MPLTLNVKILRAVELTDIVAAVDKAIEERQHVLIIFDEGLENLHNLFLESFVNTRPAQDFVVMIRGEGMARGEEFYPEIRHSIPLAVYMGANLDALDDVLGWEGVAPDAANHTYWIWRSAHVLFSRDPEYFKRIFDIMAYCARQAMETGRRNPSQPVSIILTGLWDVMGREAFREDSFFYRFPFTTHWQDASTNLVTFRVSK